MLIEEHGKIQAQMMNKNHSGKNSVKNNGTWKRNWNIWTACGRMCISLTTQKVPLNPGSGEASVHSKFLGLKEAYEKEHVDLEDKKRSLKATEAAMERCLNAINVRNSDMEKLAELHRKDELIRTEERVLAGYRRELTELSAEIKELRQALDASKEDKNKLFGKVSPGSGCD